MAEMNTIVEGKVKYREGKKWKPRWCIMKKPSPVADRLQVILYKDVKESVRGGHPKTSFPLDGFYGLESGICFDKETSVLAIICQKQITLLAFESRETLIQFEIKIRRSLGEEHQFPVRIVKVPGGSKLPLDLVRMHVHGQKFCLTSCIPPKILSSWQISDLRRFGTVEGKFCFEGGSRCGKGAGFHILCTDQAEEISEIVHLASAGKTASCRRQTSKRRSEYLEPVKNVAVSDNFFKNFQNTQVYADQNFQEDGAWPRQKRHSFSITDFRRTHGYSDNQHLMSIENVDRERLMVIYDVPPRRVRKVESVPPSPREQATNSQNIYANTTDNFSWTGEYNNNVMSYEVPVTTTTVSGKENISISDSHSSLQPGPVAETTNLTMPMSSSAPVLAGYSSETYGSRQREISQSVPNKIAEEFDRTMGDCGREDIREKLQQTELDLQKEMSLLDEILQVCMKERDKEKEKKVKHRPPPLPLKLSNLRGKSFDSLSARGSLDNISISSDITHTRPCTTGYSESALLSPNLSTKLKKIPSRSKMNAPLPYVNLEKYDMGDKGSNHVHLPAASSSAPDGGKTWSGIQGQRSKGYDNVKGSDRDSVREKRISVSLPGSRENLRCIGGSDLHLDVQARNMYYSNEPIYMNERSESPPPALPPKGPALLNKLRQRRAAAARPPPRPPPISPKVLQKHDKLPPPYPGPRTGIHPPPTPPSPQEENYFLMGAQQSIRQEFESQRLQEALAGRTFVKLPPREHKSSVSSSVSEEGCYMDMSVCQYEIERSKSFNDANTVFDPVSHRPKFHRSLSASGVINKPVPEPPIDDAEQSDIACASAGNSPKVSKKELIRETNYMLMSSVISQRKSVIENLQSLQEYVNNTKSEADDHMCSHEETKKMVAESVENETRPVLGCDNSIKVEDIEGATGVECGISEVNVEKPFDNLLDFTLHTEDSNANKCPPLFMDQPSIIAQEKSKDKTVVTIDTNNGNNNGNGKSQGFFSRFIRRNSKDRKSISQSQENLLSSASSEPSIKEGMAILMESISSEESSRSQSQEVLVLDPKDRSRSSSFPNRSSYRTMSESESSSSTGISVLSQESDLGGTFSLASSGTVSTHASSNDEHLDRTGECVLSDSEKCEQTVTNSSAGSYESKSYFYVELEDNSKTEKEESDVTDIKQKVEKETKEKHKDTADEDCENKDKRDRKDDSDSNSETDSQKFLSDQGGGKVFTVLNVQGGNLDCMNSCKTDDEKLIELWHSTHSLNDTKSDKDSIADLKSKLTLPLDELSPDQKANAIARHISSLPPFVPPKMKTYPMKLSPVLEKASPIQKNGGDNETDQRTGSDPSEMVDCPVSSPALMKQQAKATLRITPPSEDENGKIWIPRTEETQRGKHEESSSEQETKCSTIVVNLTDMGDDADRLSVSSLDSNIHGEETVRSSPASTILRPRSGKEYQKIQRRRTTDTTDDSVTASPLTTPQSPAGASVFTFDTTFISSTMSGGELHSPKLGKLSQAELASMSYSLRSDSVQSPRAMYMNIDLSPPESPLPANLSLPANLTLPAEQLEPQLNYAEIDLSEAGRLDSLPYSKRSRRTTEPAQIEYSMIDMVATRAASKARRQHALTRDGSLRRDRSSVSVSSAKERLSSLTLPSKTDKKQSQSAGVAQSSTSVNSTNF